MYTKVKDVQILIALMKEHGISHVVISAGSRHVPFVQSVENDIFFNCYSVVDERSACYFAIGLYKRFLTPIAVVCTSAAATCNYFPAVFEAFQQNIPLLILTADRHPAYLDQMEDQMIKQNNMYGMLCKKAVNLPWVVSPLDSWQCQRFVNEAILELNHHGVGPVQINFPNHTNLIDNADLSVATLPKVKVIKRYDRKTSIEEWEQLQKKLCEANRILILCGCMNPINDEQIKALENFSERYNCVIATEQLSNIHCENSLDTYKMSHSLSKDTFKDILPEIVISFGGNFYSRFKSLLRWEQGNFEHWNINKDGRIIDSFQSLTSVFECDWEFFFDKFAKMGEELKNNKIYYNTIEFKIKHLISPRLSYSSMEAINELSKVLPKNSLLHLSILNSTRIMELFTIHNSVRVYSNLGTYGIDGSMSTFLGQAAVTKDPCYLVIGDLSFFYDMNCLGIKGIGKNVHIMLINNNGAAEFHFSMGLKRIPTINDHISAEHCFSAEQWAEENGFKYIKVEDTLGLQKNMCSFVNQNNSSPVLMEVFTNKEYDGELLNSYFEELKEYRNRGDIHYEKNN